MNNELIDKELLEMAAKAVGIEDYTYINNPFYEGLEHRNFEPSGFELQTQTWNPLTDDSDALRLAVKLMMEIRVYKNCVCVESDGVEIEEDVIDDPYQATRRAIVRVAAEIGRAM